MESISAVRGDVIRFASLVVKVGRVHSFIFGKTMADQLCSVKVRSSDIITRRSGTFPFHDIMMIASGVLI